MFLCLLPTILKEVQEKAYMLMISEIDYSVGRVLKALEDNGLAENTIVVFT